jgi:hypothetical protein
VLRLQGAVARVLAAIEATIARLAAGPHSAYEMERAGRALSSLTRTLRELSAPLNQHQASAPPAYDDMPEDIDAFREQLARRICVFVASRREENERQYLAAWEELAAEAKVPAPLQDEVARRSPEFGETPHNGTIAQCEVNP